MKKYLLIALLVGFTTMWSMPVSYAIEDCGNTGCVSGPDEGTSSDDGTTIIFSDSEDD